MSTARIEAFSDGVFAIAITPARCRPTRSLHAWTRVARWLLRAWPPYASYAVSFVTIGIIWVNYHALFTSIERADRPLLVLNLLLLMAVAFIPFPTALLARYVHVSDPNANTAGVVYSATMTVMSTLFVILRSHATRGRRLVPAALHPHQPRHDCGDPSRDPSPTDSRS